MQIDNFKTQAHDTYIAWETKAPHHLLTLFGIMRGEKTSWRLKFGLMFYDGISFVKAQTILIKLLGAQQIEKSPKPFSPPNPVLWSAESSKFWN